ncbi:hypothetical protein Aab01nite_36150 [Paractinoplanes abujensis]|uniref:Uncharacterized protein n=1 Tax=Paractinoplanes abujensis TaxID=882441 RepID=A0A7W7G211_9ACTN|nr:hypothetical protein [Actinoplanes abujensis]MBB4694763.1 hypothetical protein [Actinoplanes abujensis]GID20025.1 hypothetical protein Aab01nite_36150 [Actinoplanes abujensis]
MHRISPRRGLAVCVALGALTFTAACSDDAAPDGSPAPAAGTNPAVAPAPADPAAAAAADAALTGDTKQICAQAGRTTTSFGKLFADDYKLKIEAASKGAEAKQQAAQKIARDVENFSFALTNMAAITTDTTLKSALTGMSTQVKALKGDIEKLDTDKMAALTAKLDKACGKG